MSLSPEEMAMIAAIWTGDERDSRMALCVTVSRKGRIEMMMDHDLIAPVSKVVIGDLLTRLSAREQARRRAEGHAVGGAR